MAIGPDGEVTSRIEAEQVLTLDGALVHPGFVDAHVHTGSDLIRGILPESSADWTAVEEPFRLWRSAEVEYLSALISCMEMVTSGVTLYADTGGSFELEATVKAIETVGMRGIPGYFIADEPLAEVEGLHSPTDQCLERLVEQMERYPFQDGGRVRSAVTLCGMGTASDRLLTKARVLADKHEVPMIMHQSWEAEEVETSRVQYGRRPVEHLADIGILGPGLSLVHMIQVNRHEVDLVSESGAQVVHCPAAAIRRAMGAARMGRFPEMLQAGITVALGSDGHSGKHDILRQAYLAATLHREIRGKVPTITAQTAWEMATVHGVRALGMEGEIGSLEEGKQADLVIHRIDRPESRPHFRDPVAHSLYYSHSATVDTVFVNGEMILKSGEFTRFDANQLYGQIDAEAAVLEKRIDFREKTAWPLVE